MLSKDEWLRMIKRLSEILQSAAQRNGMNCETIARSAGVDVRLVQQMMYATDSVYSLEHLIPVCEALYLSPSDVYDQLALAKENKL